MQIKLVEQYPSCCLLIENKHKMNVHDCSSWHPYKNIQKMFLWSTMACICIFVCFQFEGIIVCRLGLLTFGYGFEPHQWQLRHLRSPKILWILQLHVIVNHPSTHLIYFLKTTLPTCTNSHKIICTIDFPMAKNLVHYKYLKMCLFVKWTCNLNVHKHCAFKFCIFLHFMFHCFTKDMLIGNVQFIFYYHIIHYNKRCPCTTKGVLVRQVISLNFEWNH
jgi:hypothetical protein